MGGKSLKKRILLGVLFIVVYLGIERICQNIRKEEGKNIIINNDENVSDIHNDI